MKDAVARPLELESAKVEFLDEMVRKYSLPDVGKVVRCLINYAREHPREIRCIDC